MSLRSEFSQDQDKVTNGVPFEIGYNDDGTVPTFYISRLSATNPRFLKTMEKENRPYERQAKAGKLSTEKQTEITRRVFCKAVLTGWTNVKLADVTGNVSDEGDAPFTFENAYQLMTDLPDLYEACVAFSTEMDNYRAEQLEADAKN